MGLVGSPSVNGGGDEFRPYEVEGEPKPKSKDELDNFEDYLKENRTPVTYDNTYSKGVVKKRLRGDYAVPTLFNGNFDIVAPGNVNADAPIPGWTFSGGNSSNNEVSKPTLVDWHALDGLKQRAKKRGQDVLGTSHLEMLRVDLPGQNYALELKNQQSIEHSPFVVPEWGALRFDLHVPKAAIGDGTLKVTISDGTSTNSANQTFNLQEVAQNDDYVTSSRKVDYAPYGFDTFQLDVPDSLRGKTATVKFEVTGTSAPIYLDNVFFKSAHLQFGNPSEARTIPSQYKNNFLIERPEYTLSYNGDDNILNWASWQLNKSWKFPADKDTRFSVGKRNFKQDITLPSGFYQVLPKDYLGENGRNIRIEETKTDKKGNPVLDGDGNPQMETVKYVYGHAVPVADRDRNHRENIAISLMSNIVPQSDPSNNGVWKGFEGYVKSFVTNTTRQNHNKEVYIVAGTHGTKDVELPPRGDQPDPTPIKIPKYLWKVILVMDRPGQGVDYTTKDTYTLGLWMPNNNTPNKTSAWKTEIDDDNPERLLYVNSVNEIEEKTGYDFFSNLPDEFEERVENNTDISFPADIPDAPIDRSTS